MARSKIYTKPRLNYSDPEVKKRMKDACEAVQRGELDLAAAAKKYKLNYGTLRNRYLERTKPAKEAHGEEQLLTPEQEEVLVHWIKFLGFIGRPVSKATLRPKVQDLCGRLPGKAWIQRFLRRHPGLQLGRGAGLDPKRAQAFNFEVVNDHFNEVDQILKKKKIPWENVYNMDEKGIQLGGGRKGNSTKYFFSRQDRSKYRLRGASLELVTVIESCCADGTSLYPGFIFQGTTLDDENTDVHPDICCGTSENGWTSDTLCALWFEKTFIPQAKKRNRSGLPILLIFDGHGSHVTDEMLELAMKNNIELHCLPPHTTHKLQPLDVGVFGPLQRKWSDQCDSYVARNGCGMQRQHVVREYMEAREKAFTEENILEAWRRCGLRPFNPSIFTESDFAPSVNTSKKAVLPETYPADPPSDFDILEEPSAVGSIQIDVVGPEDFEHIEWTDTEDEDLPTDKETDGFAGETDRSDSEEEEEEVGGQGSGSEEGEQEEDEDGSDEGEDEGGSEGMGIRSDGRESNHMLQDQTQLNHMPQSPILPATPALPEHPRPSSRNATATPSSVESDSPSLPRTLFPRYPTISLSRSNSATPSSSSSLARSSLQRSHSRSSSTSSFSHELDTLLAPVPDNASKDDLRTHVMRLQGALAVTRSQRNKAESHAILLGGEYAVLKHQHNSKKTSKKQESFRAKAEYLNGPESLERRRARRAAKEAKEQKKKEIEMRKAAKEQSRLARRAELGTAFAGTLKSQNKTDLQLIARLLGLPDQGTKDALIEKIQAKFDAESATYQDDPRFQTFFKTRRGRRPPSTSISQEAGSAPVSLPPPLPAPPANAYVHNHVAGPSHEGGPSRSYHPPARYSPYPPPPPAAMPSYPYSLPTHPYLPHMYTNSYRPMYPPPQ